MVVRLIKKTWWVDFQFENKRYRRRSPKNSQKDARDYEAVLRQKLARGESIDRDAAQPADERFDAFAARWLQDYVKPNNRSSEQLAKKYILASSLIPFFGRTQIGHIRAHHIERYKVKLIEDGLTNKTIRNRLTVLNKCIRTGYEWLNLPGAPPKINWPRCASFRTDYLSADECAILLSHAGGPIYEMILTALRTGMRQGELKGLQWSSIDWQNRSLAIRHSRDDYIKQLLPPKGNRERHIPLDIDVYAMLHRRKGHTGFVFVRSNGQPFNKDVMNDSIRRLCKKAGLRTIGWHTLRHTFASHLAMRGVPMPAIKELMGHTSIVTTMRYAHVAPSTLRTAIDMLNPKAMNLVNFGQPGVNQWQEIQRLGLDQNSDTAEYV